MLVKGTTTRPSDRFRSYLQKKNRNRRMHAHQNESGQGTRGLKPREQSVTLALECQLSAMDIFLPALRCSSCFETPSVSCSSKGSLYLITVRLLIRPYASGEAREGTYSIVGLRGYCQ